MILINWTGISFFLNRNLCLSFCFSFFPARLFTFVVDFHLCIYSFISFLSSPIATFLPSFNFFFFSILVLFISTWTCLKSTWRNYCYETNTSSCSNSSQSWPKDWQFVWTSGEPVWCLSCIVILQLIFSCDQAALQMVFSVCPSVCHTFLTMFPSSYHHEIFSYYQWPK